MKRLTLAMMLLATAIVAGTAGPVEASKQVYAGAIGNVIDGQFHCDCSVCTVNECFCITN